MKKRKKKTLLPRRTWTINPVTRVKKSAKAYSRRRAQRKAGYEEA